MKKVTTIRFETRQTFLADINSGNYTQEEIVEKYTIAESTVSKINKKKETISNSEGIAKNLKRMSKEIVFGLSEILQTWLAEQED